MSKTAHPVIGWAVFDKKNIYKHILLNYYKDL
ncbi:hypothetical protein SAMN05518856_10318 [Paenibacillus sp. OK003]|nr:hypothetical protein SAMN05518856_10318 [Paenibacillus sp. OK003]